MSYHFSQSLIEDGSVLNLTSSGGNNLSYSGGMQERFACAVCGKSYLRKRHLQRHMRDECIGIPPRFSCDLCPSRFRRKYHMVRHLTSKHGIPMAIAQQTTGNRSGGGGGGMLKSHDGGDYECKSPIPENLTMRKDNYEHEHPQPHPHPNTQHHQHLAASHLQHLNFNQMGGGGSSPSHLTSGDSGSDCNGGGTAGTSPIPPAHVMPMPKYGLTGAITAISAAAAHVEEKDAKILLEAAAAAAAAHAAATTVSNNTNTTAGVITNSVSHEDNENVANNTQHTNANVQNGNDNAAAATASVICSPTNNLSSNTAAATGFNGLEDLTPTHVMDNSAVHINANNIATANMPIVKSEPLTPTKTAALNMLDDEWKMKLSLQLISNSLLKERLMNTMPFAYNKN